MANFKQPVTATVKMPANLNDSGTLMQNGETVGGQKNISMQGLKYDCTLDEANAVFDTFYGKVGGVSYDSLSADKNINVGVEQ